MTLKITILTTEVTTIRLDGQLSAKEAEELGRLYTTLTGSIQIDLSGLLFADDEGVDVLAGLRHRGAQLVNARPYLSLLLQEFGEKGSRPVEGG